MSVTPDQQAEIEAARADSASTRRAVSPGLEEMLFAAVPVLDHGFVRVVDYMGDDAAVVQAARVSYGRGTRAARDDRGLIRYLLRHAHTTPFEMCEIKLHVKLPIFVARQWIRHRTANVNEYSARYSILDREFYVPAPEQVAAQSSSNRQGRGAPFGPEEADAAREALDDASSHGFAVYEALLNEEEEGGPSLARELARIALPLSTYTQWYWKIDLHNLLHFLALRADPHAQYEIRVYADAIGDLVKAWTPLVWEAFEDYRLGGAHVSAAGLACLRRMLAGESVTQETSGMSAGEWREFQALLAE